MVRLKLKEYAELGLVEEVDSGRRRRYRLAPLCAEDLDEDLLEAVDFAVDRKSVV